VIVLDIFLIVAMPILATIYIHMLIRRLESKGKKKSLFIKRQSDNVITFNDRIDKILEEPKMPKTQSMQHVDRHTLRAIVVDDNMYWIINNAFYVADIVDGNVEENTTRLVDTMTMDKVQLDKIMFIVEKLREGD
jgi:hypothetical protein